jgi:DNA sulfur modification protein DndB
MNELESFFLKGLVSGADFATEKYRRKGDYSFHSIPVGQITQYEQEGWIVSKKGKQKARIKKQKPIEDCFEDQVWTLLADMGFTKMNAGRFFKLPYSEDTTLTQQVDIIAVCDFGCRVQGGSITR